MSLPEKIRLYVLLSAKGGIMGIYHDAQLAVRKKEEWRVAGIPVHIEDKISARGPHAVSQVEHKCCICPSYHSISVESTEGRSEVFDGCCDDAAAQREKFDLWNLNGVPPLLGMCEHEFEDVDVEHDVDEVPVSMNPFTDVIHYKTIRVETVVQACRECGLTKDITRDCECEPDEFGC